MDRMSNSIDAPPILEPLPDTRTHRLDLRRFHRDDLDGLAPVFAQEDVWRFPYGRGLTRPETERFIDGQIASWDRRGSGAG
jgi:RimJ/RimL family protein N-acetyltransferase